MTPSLDDAVSTSLGILRKLGLQGEVYVEQGRRTKVAVSDGKVDSLEDRWDRGVGIRVFHECRVGFACTTEITPSALRETAVLARDIARHTGADAAWRLPAPTTFDPLSFPNEDLGLRDLTMEERIRIASEVEEAARAEDSRIQKTREAAAIDYRGEARVAHTDGLDAAFRYSRALARLEVTAGENASSQVGYHSEFGLGPMDLDPRSVGKTAAQKALAKLGSRPSRTGRMAAVLDREVVSGLLDALAPAFSARRVLKGTSLLAGRLGETVASRAITLVDDPRLEGGFGSAPADGEGLATRRVTLIEEGRLGHYLHDTYSALRMGQGEPGNSIRSSYGSPPCIGPMNLLLLPGADPIEALVERAGDGVLIREVMGLHTADPISGDFSLGGYGRMIEGGRLGLPVDRLAISGNLLELLVAVEAVGSDLRLFVGGGGAPSLLLREMSIAGAD